MINRLRSLYSDDVIRKLFELHLLSDDPFVKHAGYSLEMLNVRIPMYLQAIDKEKSNTSDYDKLFKDN
jgi:hypothetical protein